MDPKKATAGTAYGGGATVMLQEILKWNWNDVLPHLWQTAPVMTDIAAWAYAGLAGLYIFKRTTSLSSQQNTPYASLNTENANGGQ